jgi:transcription elongation GreA/GreB family factor
MFSLVKGVMPDIKNVTVGCKVRVTLSQGGTPLFEIVSDSNNAAPERGIISASSPLGSALLGKSVGQEVVYFVQEKQLSVKIKEIF